MRKIVSAQKAGGSNAQPFLASQIEAGPGQQLHVAEGIHLFPMLIVVRRNFEI